MLIPSENCVWYGLSAVRMKHCTSKSTQQPEAYTIYQTSTNLTTGMILQRKSNITRSCCCLSFYVFTSSYDCTLLDTHIYTNFFLHEVTSLCSSYTPELLIHIYVVTHKEVDQKIWQETKKFMQYRCYYNCIMFLLQFTVQLSTCKKFLPWLHYCYAATMI